MTQQEQIAAIDAESDRFEVALPALIKDPALYGKHVVFAGGAVVDAYWTALDAHGSLVAVRERVPGAIAAQVVDLEDQEWLIG